MSFSKLNIKHKARYHSLNYSNISLKQTQQQIHLILNTLESKLCAAPVPALCVVSEQGKTHKSKKKKLK